jgi:hypothetical protein
MSDTAVAAPTAESARIGSADAVLAAALELAGLGFRVFPCHTPAPAGCSCGVVGCARPGKHPRTPHGCKDATSDRAAIEDWWRRWPEANVGVATGEGLLVVDIDGPAGHSALESLSREHGALPATAAVRTGREGGRHLWLRLDDGIALGNTSGRLGKGIDTRGDGGYVLAPPSLHASGRNYAWEASGASVAPAPTWILERLTSPPPAARMNGNGAAAAAADPLRQRRLAALGETVLERDLAELAGHSRERGTGRGTALFACAARLGRIVAAGGLDLASTWQALIGAGEGLGLDADECERSIHRGLEEGFAQPIELADRARRKRPDTSNGDGRSTEVVPDREGQDSWPALPSPALPAFPVDALPVGVARFVEAVAVETQTPPDLAGCAVLGALSAAALGAAVVDCGGNWLEELPLYILAAMPSGDRKSAVLRSVVAPLNRIEREWRESASASVRERRSRQEALKARKAKLVKKAGELDDPDDRLVAATELDDVAAQLEAIGEPVMPRLLADDATPEALGGLLARHGRIAILAAEAPLIDNLIGRYDATGSANLHLVCHAYMGEATRIDRRNNDPEQLDRPLLAITLTVQPHVLRGLIEHKTARDQGLVGRFAYALPETRLGRRRIDAPGTPTALHGVWEATVRRVIKANPLTEQTQTSSVSSVSTPELEISSISLSLSAKKLLDGLRLEQEPRLAQDGDLRPAAHWIARHPGRVARIAGLLHLAQYPIGSPIGEATMRDALRLGEYFLAHGMAALTAPDELTRRALLWLRRRGESSVTQRDLHRGPLDGRGSAEKANELAQTLVAVGALRKLEDEGPPRPGRPPSPGYAVNPSLRAR